MSAPKKSKTKSKTVAKATTKPKAAMPKDKKPSEALLVFAAICITFLLAVDTYYVYQLARLN
jgi:uncharacterized protein HemX